MNFADTVLLKLTDPAQREALFHSDALQSVADAAYDTSALALEPPFNGVFDGLEFGVAAPKRALFTGSWMPANGIERMEANFELTTFGETVAAVQAFWTGSIIARAVSSLSRIVEVRTAWPNAGAIDAAIVADRGALPLDPAALESERRTRFIALLRASLSEPGELTEAVFDRWLKGTGAASVGDLIVNFKGIAKTGTLQIAFSAPNAAASPKQLPIAAAILIRDAGFSLTSLLLETKIIREQLASLGLSRPSDPTLKLRQPLTAVWIVPSSVFDDADWPGGAAGMDAAALRDARRNAANAWLNTQGIAAVTV